MVDSLTASVYAALFSILYRSLERASLCPDAFQAGPFARKDQHHNQPHEPSLRESAITPLGISVGGTQDNFEC